MADDKEQCCNFCEKIPEIATVTSSSSVATRPLLNTCPRCNLRFCSQKCYQHPKHLQCSEAFYRVCVETELHNTKSENSRRFIDVLKRQMQNDVDDDVGCHGNQDDDSDDDQSADQNDYLKQFENLNFDEIDENELDNQLESMGIGHDTDSLIKLLTDKEKEFLDEYVRKKTSNSSYIVLKRPFKLKPKPIISQIKLPDHQELLKTNDVLNAVTAEVVGRNYGRLFAVVQYAEEQFKITESDLIVIEELQHFTVGDEIKLEKILAVGGTDFTLYGRPLIPRDTVNVVATVVEKSFSDISIDWFMKPRKRCRVIKFIRKPVSMLRINKIELVNALPSVNTSREVWQER